MKNESPKYRFDKFNENWIIVKVSDIAGQYKTGGTPSTKNPIFWEGTIPWIQSSDIQKDTLFGVIPQKFISEEGLRNSSAKLILKNSIAIVTRVGVGKLAIIDQDYATSQDFLSLSDLKGDTNFLVYSIYRMLQKESTQQQGTSIKGITKEDLLFKKISLPKLEEQSAIGSLFHTLDELLSSYKDNLVNYQSLKATMLSKMFPQVGQTVPEIRLKGFEGEWVEKCIGELADIVRGASPRPIQDPKWFDSNSEIGWLRISDVTNQNGRIHSLEQKISKLGQEKTRVLTEPHLLLSIAATVGKPVVNYVKTGVHDGFLIFMNPKFDREFMFQWLEMFREKWNRYGQPGSQVNLNSDIVKNQKILIPSMEEQCAIGTYFSNLDNLINSHQEKITQLETLKKKLLQDMFI